MEPGNILKIDTLSEAWRDKDSVMLHACFQLLKDCIENEHLLDGPIDWSADEKSQKAKVEIETLYRWWDAYTEPDIAEADSYDVETHMLMRLIAVRWALWT